MFLWLVPFISNFKNIFTLPEQCNSCRALHLSQLCSWKVLRWICLALHLQRWWRTAAAVLVILPFITIVSLLQVAGNHSPPCFPNRWSQFVGVASTANRITGDKLCSWNKVFRSPSPGHDYLESFLFSFHSPIISLLSTVRIEYKILYFTNYNLLKIKLFQCLQRVDPIRMVNTGNIT